MDIQYKSNTFLQDQKLRLLNPELKRNEEHNIKYELIEDIKTTNNLGDVTVYLPNFMELLWKQPKVVSKILLNANNKDMSEHLSYFFCHNFYENILSPDYIEYNLLYLIALIIVSFTFSVNFDIGSSMISSIQMTIILSILVSATFFVSLCSTFGIWLFWSFLMLVIILMLNPLLYFRSIKLYLD
jgi:hypothetical protein